MQLEDPKSIGHSDEENQLPAVQSSDEEELVKSRGEVSHSPLRKVKDVRSRFEAANEEDAQAHPKPAGGASKSIPKPKKDGKYAYVDLRMPSLLGRDQIDISKREEYLSAAEFQEVMGMSPEEFKKLPKWRQDQKKKDVSLF